MTSLFRVSFFAVACGFLTACFAASAAQPDVQTPPVLRVGVTANSPPMIFKENGQYVGVEAELAAALGKELGRSVTFVEKKREKLIDALCDGQFDIIMSALSITPARSYRIAFSDPYLQIGQMALARSDEKYKYVINLAAEAKRGIGVKSGTTAELLIRQEFPTARCKYYGDGDKAATALLKKKIDLFFSDGPMIWYLAGNYESKGLAVTPLVLTQEQLGWGMRRTDSQLRDAVNAFLKKAQANGQFNLLMNRWMPGFR
jgi:polar amino acid transport system substrate-binding protein